MSRLSRLKEYAKPLASVQGAGRDEKNLDYWADRAKQNSRLAPRASDGPMKLPSTGKRMEVRDSGMKPRVSRSVESVMKAAKADKNFVGSSDYMPGVRRVTS